MVSPVRRAASSADRRSVLTARAASLVEAVMVLPVSAVIVAAKRAACAASASAARCRIAARAATLSAAYRQDHDELRRVVHQMKGAAGSYGFPQLSHAAAELESSLVEDIAEEQIRRELEDLVDLCLRARSGTCDGS